MSLFELIILAIIQGLTEFLPISSSAHLALAPQILGWAADQGPLIDVMAHFGSLFAVMAYFRKEVAQIITGLFDLVGQKQSAGAQLALYLIIATPPALLLGAFLHFGGYDILLRKPLIIAATTIIFGILLWYADKTSAHTKQMDDMSLMDAAKVGLAQALALIPGTSRSGITMTAALGLGYSRTEAARFSMLMSLPIIGAGGLFSLIKLSRTEQTGRLMDGLIVAGLSFVTAYLAIAFFMKLVERIGMFPFMVYRVALGLGLLAWVLL